MPNSKYKSMKPKTIADKFRFYSAIFFLILGFLFCTNIFYYDLPRTYSYLKFGIEKEAEVVEVVFVSGGRSVSYYNTKLKIEGKVVKMTLREELLVGDHVHVLVKPNDPKNPILGQKTSSIFDLLAQRFGGYIFTGFLLAFYLLGGICTFVFLIKIVISGKV